VKAALAGLDVDRDLRNIQEQDVPVKLASGGILHWHVDDLTTFRSFRFSFATLYVQQRVLEAAREHMVAEFTKVVEFGQYAGLYYGQARGCFFESLAHSRFLLGGKFHIKLIYPLRPDSGAVLTVKPGLKKLSGINEIGALADGDYAVPLAKNFAAADAVVQPNTLLQMTVSAEHPVPLTKLKELAATLRGPGKKRLVFVVPKGQVSNFQSQRYAPDKNPDKDPNRKKKKKSNEEKNRRLQEVPDVEQWLLELDLADIHAVPRV